MNKNKTMKTAVSISIALGLALAANTAFAGRGSSPSAVRSAIDSGGADAIISELERAESLICGSCIEMVMPLLESDDYRIREVAAWWFARRPALKKELTELSLANLQVGTAIEVRNAADILGTFRHPVAIPTLSTALNRSDLDADARLAITRALGTIGHRSANDAVNQAMSDPSPDVRLQALSAWQSIRNQTDSGAAVTLLTDTDVRVRRQATALTGVYKDASARLALEAQLSDSDAGVRRNAAWALGQIGDAASRSALLPLVNDDSGLVRRVAEVSLSQLR